MNRPADDPPESTPARDLQPAPHPPAPPATSFHQAPRYLSEADLGGPVERIERRRLVPILLFLATCFFTFSAGTYGWEATLFGVVPSPKQKGEPVHPNVGQWDPAAALEVMSNHWQSGLIYMLCVMSMLVAHEMGHFLMTVRYHIPASYPIFLPAPLMWSGTLGAVIGMEGSRANRKQLFDIGLAGPLAGLVITIPLVVIGVLNAEIVPPEKMGKGGQNFGDPLLATMLMHWLRDIPEGGTLLVNPVYMAGWIGMFITGLNMLPLSQLDGGHVVYALFRKKSHLIARGFLLAAIAFIVVSGSLNWSLMVVIITLIGVDHPPTYDDNVELGPVRMVLGTLSLAIPIFCFTPTPIYLT